MHRLIIGALAVALVGVLLGVQPGTETQADPAGKIYWTDTGTGKIQRANADGSNAEDLVTGLDDPYDIAVDVNGGKMYWRDLGKIQRANLDGTDAQDLVTGLDGPCYVTLDLAGGKIYWIEAGTGKIQRANLDGRDLEDLVTDLVEPRHIELDVHHGRIYWTDWRGMDPGKIQRASLDGSSVEDLITGFIQPTAFALDASGGWMYWWDLTDWTFRRARLDGTGVEPLPAQWPIFYLALDVTGGKIYWVEHIPGWPYPMNPIGSNSLRRANLDGSGQQHVAGTVRIGRIALDVEGGKVYWTEHTASFTYPSDPPVTVTSGEPKIRRANLDGSDEEDVVTEVELVSSIALDIPPAPPPPTPTATPPATPTPVGGSGLFPDVGGAAALPAAGSGAGSGGSPTGWGIAAVAVLGATALGGAAWYARRKRVGRR